MDESAASPYQAPQYRNEKHRTSRPVILILLGVIGIAAVIAMGNYRYRQALRAEAAMIQARRAAQTQLQQLEAAQRAADRQTQTDSQSGLPPAERDTD
ncbi:MAG: hypothetical protein NXI04_14390 [Planctomycetaceae bacterium]|nr:hypothetical protein [Planctomycetaceae bacterium]